MIYDPENIFAKIIRKALPAKIIYEDEQILAFHDINPSAPVHVLVIPKRPYCNYVEFMMQAEPALVTHFFNAIKDLTEQLGIQHDFRLVTNTGALSGQSVLHFHVHILGGKALGALG